MAMGPCGVISLLAAMLANLPTSLGATWITRTSYLDSACTQDSGTLYFLSGHCHYGGENSGMKYTLSSGTVTGGVYASETCAGTAISVSSAELNTCTLYTKFATATVTKSWMYYYYTSATDCSGTYREMMGVGNTATSVAFSSSTNTLAVVENGETTTVPLGTCMVAEDSSASYMLQEVTIDGSTYTPGSASSSPRSTFAIAPLAGLAATVAAVAGIALGYWYTPLLTAKLLEKFAVILASRRLQPLQTLDSCNVDGSSSEKYTSATVTKYYMYYYYMTAADCSGTYAEMYRTGNAATSVSYSSSTNTLTVVDGDGETTNIAMGTCLAAGSSGSYILKEVTIDGSTYTESGIASSSQHATVPIAPLSGLVATIAVAMGAGLRF